MGRFECEDVDDPLHKFVVVLTEEFGDHFIVVLQYLIEAIVDSVLLELDGMVEDDVYPVLTDV